MQNINCRCRTNLDGYNCSIVKEMCGMPSIGNYVQVSYKGNLSRLKIVAIEHHVYSGGPYLEIELNR